MRKRKRRRLRSIMAVALCFSLIVACICEVLCTADTINTDCPVCGADDADLTLCVGKASSDVIDEAVTAVQEQINALPTVEEMKYHKNDKKESSKFGLKT